MTIATVLQRINIKMFMVVYLAIVLIIAAFFLQLPEALVRALIIIALYAGANVLWTWLREKTTYLPLSSIISGLICSILLPPIAPWWAVIAMPIIAASGKQLLQWHGKHIFNPAALAAVLLALVYPPAISWWAVAWWNAPLKIAGLLVGVFVITRIRRWHAACSFTVVYGIGLLLSLARPPFLVSSIASSWAGLLFDGTVIFFVTVMLVEPVTTSYRTKRLQTLYGGTVGLLALLLPYTPLPLPDGFLPPLLIGNLLFALASARRLRSRPTPAASSLQAPSVGSSSS